MKPVEIDGFCLNCATTVAQFKHVLIYFYAYNHASNKHESKYTINIISFSIAENNAFS